MAKWKAGDRVRWTLYAEGPNTGTVIAVTDFTYVKPDNPQAQFTFESPYGMCWKFSTETRSIEPIDEVACRLTLPQNDIPCPNSTCGKPNDSTARTCWWCEGRLGPGHG